jgi:hypothetical protein
MTDKQIDQIVKKANNMEFVKSCELNVCFHQTIHKWQFIRLLKALEEEGYKVVKL